MPNQYRGGDKFRDISAIDSRLADLEQEKLRLVALRAEQQKSKPTQPISCKDRPGAVTQQPLQPLAVCRFDPHLGVEGEAAAVVPALHLLCIIGREQATPDQQAQHPFSDLLLGRLDHLSA